MKLEDWVASYAFPVRPGRRAAGPQGQNGASGLAVGGGAKRNRTRDVDLTITRRALDDVRAALAPHETADGVLLGGAGWLVTAAAHGGAA